MFTDRDRQGYHTDGTLHMIRNVQVTDRNITYPCKGMYRDRQEYHTDGTLHIIGNVQGQTI